MGYAQALGDLLAEARRTVPLSQVSNSPAVWDVALHLCTACIRWDAADRKLERVLEAHAGQQVTVSSAILSTTGKGNPIPTCVRAVCVSNGALSQPHWRLASSRACPEISFGYPTCRACALSSLHRSTVGVGMALASTARDVQLRLIEMETEPHRWSSRPNMTTRPSSFAWSITSR